MDARIGGSPRCRSKRARSRPLGPRAPAWTLARAARTLVCAFSVAPRAVALAVALGYGAHAAAQTPVGTTISNRALVSYAGNSGRAATAYSNAVDLVTVVQRTRARITLTRLTSGAPGYVEAVGPSVCTSSGASLPLAAPVVAGRAVDPDAQQPLIEAATLHGGEPIFVRLADADHNLDSAVRDSVDVAFSAPSTGDRETVRLTETAVASGVFAGYVPSAASAAAPANCVLEIARGATLEAAYVDADDPSDEARAQATLDPASRVFDSATGELVDGVRVTLVDAATGAPAAVLGDDGVSAFPASVVTGAETLDAAGAAYRFARGEFRFPLVPPGRYRLVIEPPEGFDAPSKRTEPELAQLPGAPFKLAPASFGADVALDASPFLALDVPVDPVAAAPWFLDKRASVTRASVGDFVEYRLTLTRPAASSGPITIEDRLPFGMRYRPGSARLRDSPAPIEPLVSADGRGLTFEVADPGAARDVQLSYAVAIVPGAQPGEVVNVARAQGVHGTSNEAQASVAIVDDLFRNEAFLVGRVAVGSCDAAQGAEQPGFAGARVYLEDGRYAISDDDGRFHFEGVRPGTHVAQLDRDSLPAGVDVVPCASDSRFAGSAFSRFVELAPGALGRADFYVTGEGLDERATAPASGAGAIWSDEPGTAPRLVPVVARVAPREPATERGPDDPPRSAAPDAAEMPDFDVATLAPQFEWLWPPPGFSPAIPSTKVAIQHSAAESVALTLNGRPVSELSFDGTATVAGRGAALSRWRGLDLADGPNVLVAQVNEPDGRVQRFERELHFAGPPVRGVVDAASSRLLADGQSRPAIAVRFFDRWGQPARSGAVAEFRVESPYRSWLDVERLRDNPVVTTRERAPTLRIGDDGVALVELEPTTRAGEVVVTIRYADLGSGSGSTGGREERVRAWLEPAQRDWVLVGFAEGTIGYEKLHGALDGAGAAGLDSDYYDDGRLAFFAKGAIKGSVLTVALDSAGASTPANEVLGGEIDPDRYYTVYGDATEQRFDAATREHLYLKVERRAFMAMFGDFDAGLTVTELGRYNRSFTGFKSERHGERVSYSAFAAESRETFVKDELDGNGTSGPYRLTRAPILAGSDKLTLEVRDRFRPDRIVSTRTLVRHFDYDIDYATGTLFFKEPVPSRDFDFNPVYVVADYESSAVGRSGMLGGGRAAVQLGGERAELGVTLLRDGTAGANAALGAADFRYRFGAATELAAEVGSSERDFASGVARGEAYRLGMAHRSGPREIEAYMKETQPAFGLGQQSSTEQGTRRAGLGVRQELNSNWVVKGEGFRQESLLDGSLRDVLEGETRYQDSRRTASSGLRRVDETLPTQRNEVVQAFAGGSWRFLDDTLTTRVSLDSDLSSDGSSADYPQRAVFGADLALGPAFAIFGEHEIADGAQLDARTTRFGVKATPTDRMRVDSSLNEALTEYGPRTYATLGLVQGFTVGERWTLDVGGERSKTLRSPELKPLDSRVPLASGSRGEDFSAAYFGAGYRAADWSVTTRLEQRATATDMQRALLGGFFRERVAGRAFSAELRIVDRESAQVLGGFDGRLTLGWASRPSSGRWIFLERADWIATDGLGGSSATRNRRLVNNWNASFVPNAANELGLQYAVKLVSYDGEAWSGESFLDLLGVEWRRQLAAKLDVGLHVSVYRAPSAGIVERGTGFDFGINVATNLELAVGYNFTGFADEDFSAAGYTAAGPFVTFRLKIDQASLRDLLRR